MDADQKLEYQGCCPMCGADTVEYVSEGSVQDEWRRWWHVIFWYCDECGSDFYT